MHNKWQVYVGAAIIVVGVLSLIGSVFDIDPGALCFPIVLIVAGILVLLRPESFTAGRLKLLGNVRRYGTWQVADEEFYIGVGDVRLDMARADIPAGETRIRALLGVGNAHVLVPEGVGVSVSCMGLVFDTRVLGRKQTNFLAPFEMTSEGYETAERKLRLETVVFVGDVRVRRAQTEQM